jgi:hypothetical protein
MKQSEITCGCLAGGTIVMTSGGDRKIEEIRIGDILYNPLAKKFMSVRNTWQGIERERLHIISAGGKKIKSSYEHPFFTPDGVYRAEDLRAGDKIYIEDEKVAVVE